jgi:SOS-response transcriptional repressor LexA
MSGQNWGFEIRALREKSGLTQDELAQKAGVTRSWLSRVEIGHYRKPPEEPVLKKLSRALQTDLNDLKRRVYGLPSPAAKSGKEELRFDTERMEEMLRTVALEVTKKMGELVNLPTRGYVPAGYPLSNEEMDLTPTPVPAVSLGAYAGVKDLYVLIVSGDSMTGDGIQSGFKVVVNPEEKSVVDGKIYVVRVENEVTVKHVAVKNGRMVLSPSNRKYRDLRPEQIEILGRVILAGNWKEL